MKSLKQTLMQRDNLTSNDADILILDAKEELHHLITIGDIASAERICEDWFGLEPDYLIELL